MKQHEHTEEYNTLSIKYKDRYLNGLIQIPEICAEENNMCPRRMGDYVDGWLYEMRKERIKKKTRKIKGISEIMETLTCDIKPLEVPLTINDCIGKTNEEIELMVEGLPTYYKQIK